MSSSNIFTRRCLWFYSIFVVVVAVCDCWNVTPCISNCSSIQRMWRRERERERERATKKMLENYYHVTHSLFIYFPSARQLWERKECANIKNNGKQVNVIANRFLVCSCVCVCGGGDGVGRRKRCCQRQQRPSYSHVNIYNKNKNTASENKKNKTPNLCVTLP